MATTLLQLRGRTRYFLDELATSGVTWLNAELNQYINDAQYWLWSEFCKQDDSFGLREASQTLVSGQTDYNYPSDILGRNLRSMYAYTTTTDPWQKVEKGTYEEVIGQGSSTASYPSKYCCLDGFFKIGPPPDSSGFTVRISYTRMPTVMTSDDENMDSDDIFAELIAAEAAIRALARTGGDASPIKGQHAKLLNAAFGNVGPDDLLTATPLFRYKADFVG